DLPLAEHGRRPRISVVVCSYNGARTLGECLDGVLALDYPEYEVIVVSDGSTDATAELARARGVRVVETPNRGLSSARNTGLAAATGEIVAYLDDDARPDPHWLHYVADAMQEGDYAAVGGPNIPPPDEGWVADCVARAPGGAAGRAYLRKQRGYGAAEALLERKWPERYNAAGHVPWEGRVYGRGVRDGSATRRGRVYFGVWGSAAFQAMYRPGPSVLAALPGIPEWYLLVAALAAISALGVLSWPFLLALPVLG